MSEDKTYTQAEVDELVAAQVGGLKANRDEVLKEAKTAKAALAKYEGVDPEEFKRLRDAAADAERKKAASEGDFKSLERQMVEKHIAEMATKDAEKAKLKSALEYNLVQAQLTKAIAQHKGDADLLLPHAARHVRTRETESGWEAYVADDAGNARIADGKGTPMSFDDLVVQELMAKYPRAFEGTGSSGGGASKSAGGAGGVRVISADDPKAFLANVANIAAGKTEVR